MRSKQMCIFLGICLLFTGFVFSQNKSEFKYHSPKETNQLIKKLANSNKSISKIHTLSKSRSGEAVYILEIGNEVKQKKKKTPAILVVANLEGVNPLATEAALFLSKLLLKKDARQGYTWYVMPMGNPDAALRYFSKPLYKCSRNLTPVNDDKDDKSGEDGYEDLDKNGIITQMGVKDPAGKWMPIKGNKRLMKRADWKKGEKGVYKLYTEGIDNDRDGKYNEDGKGGVNLAVQFPHLFKFFTKSGGLWAGSEKTVYNLFRFVFTRPEIAMTMNFNDTNFLLQPPQAGRRAKADYSKIKIPKRFARMGFDTERTYTMKEIMEKVQEMVPAGMQITESMVAGFLGLGAVVNPLRQDLEFYELVSKAYKKYLKDKKFEPKRYDPKKAKDGSFELWSYYHLGLPSFTMDFWTLPKPEKKGKKKPMLTPEKLEKMSKEEFLALGKEKIQKFLKSVGAPKNIKAEMVIKGVEGGMMTPKRMAGMLKRMMKGKDKKSAEGADPFEKALVEYSDKVLKGKGFVEWKPFNHPTLGKVEIGGIVPFAATVPPVTEIEKLLKAQVPYVLELPKKLPKIKIASAKQKRKGGGVYEVTAWVENSTMLPYSTEMGQRNGRIPPIVVTLKGKNVNILQGQKRALIRNIKGYQKQKIKWLLHTENPVSIRLVLETKTAGTDSKTLNLGGK